MCKKVFSQPFSCRKYFPWSALRMQYICSLPEHTRRKSQRRRTLMCVSEREMRRCHHGMWQFNSTKPPAMAFIGLMLRFNEPHAAQKAPNPTLGLHGAELSRLVQPANTAGVLVPSRLPVQRGEMVDHTAQTRQRRKWFYFHWARSTTLTHKITLVGMIQLANCSLYFSKVNKSEV